MQEIDQTDPIKEAKKLLEVCIKKIDIFLFENKIEVKDGATTEN